MVLDEDDMTEDVLIQAVNELYEKRHEYHETMKSSALTDSIPKIMELIKEAAQ